MGRPFAIFGFTMFATLFFLCFCGKMVAVVMLIAAVLLLAFFYCVKRLRAQKVLLLSFAALLFSSALFLTAYTLRVQPYLRYAEHKTTLKGIVYDYPDFRNEHYYYEIKATSIGADSLKLPTVIRLSMDEELSAKPGQTLTFTAELFEMSDNNTFSKLNYLSKGIVLGARCESVQSVENGNRQNGLHFLFAEYRHALVQSLRQWMPADNAALSAAVLTGDKSYINSGILELINQVGISHIICVSGLHLSVLAAALLYCFGKLKLPRVVRYSLAAVCILFFMALCGFSNSVLRAGIMFFVYIFAELFLAEPDSENSLGIATIVVLLNPFAAANIGFIFSFCATLAIIRLGAPCLAFCKEKWEIAQKPFILRRLFSLLEICVISLCVNFCCLPMSLLIFQKVSLISIFANVLILPFASVLLVSAGLSALLGLLPMPFFGWLSYPCAFVNSSLSAYTLKLVAMLNRSRIVTVAAGDSELLIIIAVILCACGAAGLLLKKKNAVRVFAFVSIVCVVFSIAATAISSRNRCQITVHSVGYGFCVSVQCGGEFYIIDTGEGDFAYSKVNAAYLAANAQSIRALLLTGESRSESANALKITSHFTVEKLICGNDNSLPALTPLKTTQLVRRSEYVLEEPSGLRISFSNREQTTVMVEFQGMRVLILPNAKFTLAMLPKDFRSFEYLIIHGAFNKYVVNSALNGIIEVSQKEGAGQWEQFADYAVYSTAAGQDVKLMITKTKTTIGRVNQWQR